MLARLLLAVVLLFSACSPSAGDEPDAGAGDGGTVDGGRQCERHDQCDDDNPCTDDRCNESGFCENTPNGVCACQDTPDCAQYEDGDLCNGTLVCEANVCVLDPDTVVTCDSSLDTDCRKNTCAPATGLCAMVDEPPTISCDDGDDCTDPDHCSGGVCVGPEVCCFDGIDNDGDGPDDCDDPDCDEDPVCNGGCIPVAQPDPVPLAPLPGEATPGTFETVTAGGFTDDYVYNMAHSIKVGARREWGGTIIFFGMDNGSPGMNNTNTIDANDTGREVQVAFYDPDRHMQNCAWNASCQSTPTSCPFSITYLGWNPVQGGNRCNNGSDVESVDLQGGVITISTNPLFWNPNWDRTDCDDSACDDPVLEWRRSDVRVIQRLRFVRQHVVELEYDVINLAAIDHASTAQEMPTVYTANGQAGPDLWRLFNSAGTEIVIDTPGNDGFFYENFQSPGGWVTMQNEYLDYGVGMYYENRLTDFQGWQKRSLPFNNFRAIFPFAIPASGEVRARTYLILGSQATVASEAGWLDEHLAPFGFLDAPAAEATVSGTINVGGWALDNKGVAAVELVVDGAAPISLTYGTSRPDVCSVYPLYANCNNVGFSGSLDTSTLTACHHLLEINAVDGDGNERIIARSRILVSP